MIDNDKVISFDKLKHQYALEKQDFYLYLQLHHYINTKMESISEANTYLIGFFTNSYDGKVNKLISILFKYLANNMSHSTNHVKTLWEKGGGIIISQQEWIWKLRWICTNSQRWREYG